MDKNTVIINGRKVYFCVTRKSNAPKIVLLHGYGGDHRGLVELSEAIPGYDFVIPDLPGHGFSETLADKHTLENYADFLEKFLEALNLPKVSVIGHSLGGSIAGVYAGKYPKRVERLCLIAPVIIGNNWLVQAAKVYFKTADILPAQMGKRMLDNKFVIYVSNRLVLTSPDAKKRKKILQQNYINYRRTAGSTLVESYMTYFTSPLLDYAQKITTKTLVLGGESDFISPPDSIKLLAGKIQDHSLVMVEKAGHLAPLEIPEKIAAPIRGYLKKQQ